MSNSHSDAHQNAQPFVTPNDVDAYQQRVNDLNRALQIAIESGDASTASRLAGQTAEAKAELKTVQAQFESQRVLYEQENAWIKQQTAKVYEIQQSISQQRALLDDTQRMLQQYFNEQHHSSASPSSQRQPSVHHSKDTGLVNSLLNAFTPSPPPANNLMSQRHNQQARQPSPEPAHVSLIAKARHNIRLAQVNLEQQNLKVDSIDMTSHPSASNDAHAAAIAANPSESLLSIKAVRKDTVARIQQELAHADKFAHHVDEFEKFITFIHQPIPVPPNQSNSNAPRGQQKASRHR